MWNGLPSALAKSLDICVARSYYMVQTAMSNIITNVKQLVIITGSLGLLGTNIARELNNRGFTNLILVDNLRSSEKWKNLIGLKYESYYEHGEFREKINGAAMTGGYYENCLVVHAGATSATTEKDAAHLYDNNYRYTTELIDWTKKRNGKIVYASSASTYGLGENGYKDDQSLRYL